MRITITSIIHRILSNWKQWLPYLSCHLKRNYQHLDQHFGGKIWWNPALTWKGLKSCSKQTSPTKHISRTPNRRTISCIVVNVEITPTNCGRRIFCRGMGETDAVVPLSSMLIFSMQILYHWLVNWLIHVVNLLIKQFNIFYMNIILE